MKKLLIEENHCVFYERITIPIFHYVFILFITFSFFIPLSFFSFRFPSVFILLGQFLSFFVHNLKFLPKTSKSSEPRVVFHGYFHALFALFFPLEYITTIPPHSTYVIGIFLYKILVCAHALARHKKKNTSCRRSLRQNQLKPLTMTYIE